MTSRENQYPPIAARVHAHAGMVTLALTPAEGRNLARMLAHYDHAVALEVITPLHRGYDSQPTQDLLVAVLTALSDVRSRDGAVDAPAVLVPLIRPPGKDTP